MSNNNWHHHVQSYRLRSARQKRRSLEEDREKQLIQLEKQRKQLWQEERNLPMIPLAEPYRKGWKRSFILREDLRRGPRAIFYQTLLDKINTIQFSSRKTFVVRMRRSGKKVYEPKPQTLVEFRPYDFWHCPKTKLTDEERKLFHPEEFYEIFSRELSVKYVFSEPWRYVLQIKPHIITHVKANDAALKSELQRLDNYIERNNLRPLIKKLMNGRSDNWKKLWVERPQYRHPFRNKPLYRILEEYYPIGDNTSDKL